MSVLQKTQIDHIVEVFEARLKQVEDMYKTNNGKNLPKKSLRFWVIVELRNTLQRLLNN